MISLAPVFVGFKLSWATIRLKYVQI